MIALWRAWRSARAAATRPSASVELLTTTGCGLCRQALPHVEAAFGREQVMVVNISGQVALEDEYVLRVPVLLWNGIVLAEGQIGEHEARVARVRRDALVSNGVDA